MIKISRRQLVAGAAALPFAAPLVARAQSTQLRLGLITPVAIRGTTRRCAWPSALPSKATAA